jgi:ATP-binding cassette subfamily B protein
MLALSWRYRWGCLKVLALQLSVTLLTLAGLAATGLGIDLVHHFADPEHPLPSFLSGRLPLSGWPPLAIVAAMSAAVLAFGVLRAVLTFRYHVAAAKLVHEQIVVDLRAEVYDKLQRLSFRFFDRNASSSVINRVTGDVQAVRMFIDGVLIQLVIVLLSLVTYIAYMTSIHPGLTLACLATTPIMWCLSSLFARVVRPAYDRNRQLVDRMILVLSENVQGVQVVKGFARQREEVAKFAAANRDVQEQQRHIFWRVTLYTPMMNLLTHANLVILLAYGGYLVIHGRLSLGTGLIVFVGLLQQFSTQVSNIASIANSILQSLTGARRVFEILDAPLEIESDPRPVRLKRARGEVRFDDVSFGYEPGTLVLRKVSFAVQPGQCVAILGATGAGKSTLLSLIPRFYDPLAGRVLIDGIDARRLHVNDLRRNVGLVFQESFLFSNTIAANIAFGNPQASREEIEAAARIAAAHEFIRQLPEGYDTVLGESGLTLSGGQRQRLAIARAVLRQPSILILDDPTAAIDPETEHEILAAMEQAMRGRTTFVVAHRLSTLRRADFVLVLDQGRIVQTGTHNELMKAQGHYKQAARLQEVA